MLGLHSWIPWLLSYICKMYLKSCLNTKACWYVTTLNKKASWIQLLITGWKKAQKIRPTALPDLMENDNKISIRINNQTYLLGQHVSLQFTTVTQAVLHLLLLTQLEETKSKEAKDETTDASYHWKHSIDCNNCKIQNVQQLTLSLPGVLKSKIQDKSQISFCKLLKYK